MAQQLNVIDLYQGAVDGMLPTLSAVRSGPAYCLDAMH